MIVSQKLSRRLFCSLLILHILQIYSASPFPVKKVTIFIHGTLLPVFAILNPYQVYSQKIHEQNWYASCIKKIRKNPQLFEDSIILQESLVQIPNAVLEQYHQQTLKPDQSKLGAYQAIGAYDAMHRFLDAQQSYSGPVISPIDYYTFGFLGLLNNSHRKETARDLYGQLIALRTKYREFGYEPEFTLVGFSHGGNVILYLDACEAQEKKELSIYLSVLWGTPLYHETAQLGGRKLFKNIINIYSHGDSVQNKDTFSTPENRSDRRFSDFFVATPPNIVDVQICTESNNNAFGHLCFWCFNKYQTNFSWVDKQSQAVFDAFNPMPLVIITPAITHLLMQSRPSLTPCALKLIITMEKDLCTLTLAYLNSRQKLAGPLSINPVIQRAQDYALRSWEPYARTSEFLLCTTSLLAFWKNRR